MDLMEWLTLQEMLVAAAVVLVVLVDLLLAHILGTLDQTERLEVQEEKTLI